jgi:hypothetical protein
LFADGPREGGAPAATPHGEEHGRG